MFPTYNSETLAWSIGLYHTAAEAENDYPRMRAVIRAMIQHRPAQLEKERRDMVKASFGIFGRNAAAELRVIESELATAKK